MIIQFDTAKDEVNRAKHGVSLAFGARVLDDPAGIIVRSARPEDGEVRQKAIGLVDGRLWTAVHVLRANAVRFISVRRSNDAERKGYDRDPGGSE